MNRKLTQTLFAPAAGAVFFAGLTFAGGGYNQKKDIVNTVLIPE